MIAFVVGVCLKLLTWIFTYALPVPGCFVRCRGARRSGWHQGIDFRMLTGAAFLQADNGGMELLGRPTVPSLSYWSQKRHRERLTGRHRCGLDCRYGTRI